MDKERLRTVLLRILRVLVVLMGLAAILMTVLIMGPSRSMDVRDSNEVEAVASCRAYAAAQNTFVLRQGHAEHAHPYFDLNGGKDAAGQPLLLIETRFAAAGGPDGLPYCGYLFADMDTVAGKPVDWAREFALCAAPAEYGASGMRVFVVSASGTVWGRDLGKSMFVTDFPANPGAEGWELVE